MGATLEALPELLVEFLVVTSLLGEPPHQTHMPAGGAWPGERRRTRPRASPAARRQGPWAQRSSATNALLGTA